MVDDIVKALEENLLYLNNKVHTLEENNRKQQELFSHLLQNLENEAYNERKTNTDDNANDIKNALFDIKKDNTSLTNRLIEKDNTIYKLTKLNEENLNSIKVMYNENKKLSEKNEVLVNQIECIKKELQPKNNLINKQEKEISSLTNQVNTLLNEKSDLMKKLKNTENNLTSYKQWEDTFNKKITSLKKDLLTKEQLIDNLETENYQLKLDLNSLNKDMKDKKIKKNDELIKKNLNDRSFDFCNKEDIQSPRTKLRNEIGFFERKLSNLLEQLKVLESEFDKSSSKQIKSYETKLLIKEQENNIEIIKKEANDIRIKLRELHISKSQLS